MINKIFTKLINAKNHNILPHTYLLYQNNKMNVMYLAKFILCESSKQNKIPCNICKNCLSFSTKNNQNNKLLILEPNLKFNKIIIGKNIDEINTMKWFLAHSYLSSINKNIRIIFNADQMVITAQNMLLKILENPPNNYYFILSTNKISSLLPTIISRCHQFTIDNTITKHITNHNNEFKKILFNINNKKNITSTILQLNTKLQEIYQNKESNNINDLPYKKLINTIYTNFIELYKDKKICNNKLKYYFKIEKKIQKSFVRYVNYWNSNNNIKNLIILNFAIKLTNLINKN